MSVAPRFATSRHFSARLKSVTRNDRPLAVFELDQDRIHPPARQDPATVTRPVEGAKTSRLPYPDQGVVTQYCLPAAASRKQRRRIGGPPYS